MADGASALRIEACESLKAVKPEEWNAVANPEGEHFDPFLTWEFLEALESSGCATMQKGWAPAHLLARDDANTLIGAMPLYFKEHSFGEYVFDQSWADALSRIGLSYYPKLQCAVPFTPATGRRLLGSSVEVRNGLAAGALELARRARASSLHVTFAPELQADELSKSGFMRRTGVQFHWTNDKYKNFEDFLFSLSSQKRKAIRKERERANEGLTIRTLVGDEITEHYWDFFFHCYMDTGGRKWGHPYLNREFFNLLGERLKENVILFVAENGKQPIAAALNLVGGNTLYGRYWGRVQNRPFLHFELCYYRALDFAIERGLLRVEAGAQGEHKLARGYAPVPTYSAHWIAHGGLRDAVAQYLERERPAVAEEIEHLGEHTPFKKED